MSDVDRAQTASVLRMAAAIDPAVGRRFFDAYRAQERLEQLRGLGVGLRVQGAPESAEIDGGDVLGGSGQFSALGRGENGERGVSGGFGTNEWVRGADSGADLADNVSKAKAPPRIEVSDLFREEGQELGGSSPDPDFGAY